MMINDWNPSSIEVLPAMTYLVEITGWKRDRNKNSQNENIRWDAKVVKPSDYAGKSLADFITITENSIWRLKAFIGACLNLSSVGYKLPVMDTNGVEFENILNSCKGRQMFWNVFVDNYNGKESNKTTQKDPYGEWSKNPPYNVEDCQDVPDWVKDGGIGKVVADHGNGDVEREYSAEDLNEIDRLADAAKKLKK